MENPGGQPDGAGTNSGYDPRSPRARREFAEAQVLTIALANALIVTGVYLCLRYGYPVRRNTPPEFLLPEVVVMIVGVVVPLYAEGWGKIKRLLFTRPGEAVASIRQIPDRIVRALVFVLTLVTAYGLARLVIATGGLVDSPFTPLMTAPVVFGPFMARGWKSILVLAFVGVLTVWLIALLHHPPEGAAKADTAVYAAVATVILFLAALLSAVRRRLLID